MKKYFFLICFLPLLLFCNTQSRNNDSSEKIYRFLKQSLPKNSTIVFLNINKNNKEIIEKTQNLILRHNYFYILDENNLSNLARQAMLQDEPHFQNSESHKFIPSDWGIFIKGKSKTFNFLLKKIIVHDYLIKIDSIKSGITKNIYHLHEKQKIKIDLKYLVLSLLITTILLIYIQFLTKGYYGIFIIFVWIFINLVIVYVYFFI